ncbi:pentatricopeptide repeat-containing protein At2g44880-like [Punica granatum]|uniref:Pentatricopeptide repeat-containing protein At2g44880-like n=2 Tax=Punica granatum TaxID=22663 RepID=A0A218Y0Q5_PUNGR|nr:pentatricopeptide repeat-containing protein At2g44880-like [Punica granatum]XP_031397335.1 pentatricopeptide repeat-containing protein At2g44880-like [Punica granatum]XP_031397336.1 pentatricopeptide repeat-containing protein At2g44880-like [Punica granatum]XP_031397337.1 pentatricopeptide repeat-containing protein At2g44880-like [Punica granatum]XP_031397338.1 pentatricopeptide repeat-containing protein At2g44880-like [Punica granatum]XP_031397339.1 pentatricopeptide repeat-containing prot
MQQSLWTPIERNCLHLLQCKKHSKASVLQIHAFMLRHALDTNVNLFTKLLTCYSSLLHGHVRRVFDASPHKDDGFLCNILIRAYVGVRQYEDSLVVYRDLKRHTRFVPDSFTFTALVKSCSSSGMFLWEGLQLQSLVVKIGLCLDLYVSTSFVDMYAKWGRTDFARKVFDEMPERSLVSWTALVGGYVKSGDISTARKLFEQMPEKDLAAFNLIIDGYVKLGEMESAKRLFDEMPERNVITCTSMIYGYCHVGDTESACLIFESMPDRNLYTWNVMISGYSQNNQPHEALGLFHQMQLRASIQPDEVTIVSILPAIADLGALDLGSWVHQFVRKKKLDRKTNVCTALIDMFAKCGAISEARTVFDEMRDRELASWNALINGLAINGCGQQALEIFLEMQRSGYKPNEVTLLGVLSACNHAGLLEEGKRWFKAMDVEFGLTPEIEHYGCMVDLLGRAGCLDEAENLINHMPYKVNGIILSSFLFGCGYFKDAARADRVIKNSTIAEPWNDGNYVILRNLYAMERRWRDAEEIKGLMRERGANKEIGCSVIEIDGEVREFVAGDRMHPKWQHIHSTLGRLFVHMEELDTHV